LPDGFGAVGGQSDVVSGFFEVVADQIGDVGLVLDCQHAQLRRGCRHGQSVPPSRYGTMTGA
jgi:hypothetical protein